MGGDSDTKRQKVHRGTSSKKYNAKGGEIMRRGAHPCNRYQDYERETNPDVYEYKKRQFEREERYWWEISRMNDEMLYGNEDW